MLFRHFARYQDLQLQAKKKLLCARNIYSRDRIESPERNRASIAYIDMNLRKIELVKLIQES